jgi:dTDP-4-amino-4,6-dideoxygalactose transaminase
LDSFYKNRPLGSIGHIGCLSFHRSKNIQCGEGGAIIINDARFAQRVVNILEKGTNRKEFLSGIVERYEWVEIGSSCLMTELHGAFLYAQIEQAEWIKEKRLSLWNLYYKSLKNLEEKSLLRLPQIPNYADHNAHTFFMIMETKDKRFELESFLKENNIKSTIHYSSLDRSAFWTRNHNNVINNINSMLYNDCLLRIPLFNSMTEDEAIFVMENIFKYYRSDLM